MYIYILYTETELESCQEIAVEHSRRSVLCTVIVVQDPRTRLKLVKEQDRERDMRAGASGSIQIKHQPYTRDL